MDTRTQRNIAKLSEDLTEVHSIMTRNIAEVLGQGERLDSECSKSSPSTGWLADLMPVQRFLGERDRHDSKSSSYFPNKSFLLL
jgi:hypothetical protein